MQPDPRSPSAAKERAVIGCRYPDQCGSDGKTCCHYECWFSSDRQIQREHLRALAARGSRRGR